MLKLVTPPATPVVSLAEAKSHLRVLHDDDNDYIEALVEVGTGLIDGVDGWLGRAIVEQTWEASLDRFPCSDGNGRAGKLVVPLAPLISVETLKYDGSDGVERDVVGFRAFGAGSTQPGYVVPAVATSWPTTICEPESVRVTFKAGYDVVPAGIKHAILLMIGHWYESREDARDVDLNDIPLGSKALLMPHRNWRG